MDIKPYFSHSVRGLASHERSLILVCGENRLRYVLVSYPFFPHLDALCRFSPLFFRCFDLAFDVTFYYGTLGYVIVSHCIVFLTMYRHSVSALLCYCTLMQCVI
jgi:hypothetical protein